MHIRSNPAPALIKIKGNDGRKTGSVHFRNTSAPFNSKRANLAIALYASDRFI
jgi:hypothetical protein